MANKKIRTYKGGYRIGNMKRSQKVLITLTDGTKIVFFGPEQIMSWEDNKIGMVEIKFTEGKELKKGQHFERVKKG